MSMCRSNNNELLVGQNHVLHPEIISNLCTTFKGLNCHTGIYQPLRTIIIVVNRIPNETDQNESNHLLAWVACVSWLICKLATVLSASLTPRKVAQRVSSNVIISYQERRN